MTTSSFTGVLVTFDDFGDTQSVVSTTLDLVTTDDVNSLRYSIQSIENSPIGSAALVQVDVDLLNLVIGGARYAPSELAIETSISEFSWGGDKQSVILVVLDQNSLTDSVSIFVLSGDPLPVMTTPAEFDAFSSSVTALSAVTTGPVGPNVDILFSSLPTFASSEVDQISGAGFDDSFVFSLGADHYDGNGGTDAVDYSSATGRVLADLQIDQSGSGFARFFAAGAGQGDTYEEIENLIGGGFADNLRGDGAANLLEGNGVSDRLYGRGGDDTLNGGAGVDALYGNLGVDQMTGGPGAATMDRFIYFSMAETGVGDGNRDIITDFQTGVDRIEIRRFDADTTQGGRQGFNFIADAAFSNTAGELRFEQTGGNTIVQGDVNGDGLADFEIELTGTITMVESDFLI